MRKHTAADVFLYSINFLIFFITGFSLVFYILYSLLDDTMIKTVVIFSFTAGFILLIFSILNRKKLQYMLIHNRYYCFIVYCAYMIVLFGVFMGVPVFNVLPGIMYAFLYGMGLSEYKDNGILKKKHSMLITISIVLLAVFCASAYIALKDPYTGDNLKGMLGLNNTVSQRNIVLIIIGGGSVLLLLQLYFANKLFSRGIKKIKGEQK